MPQLKRRGHAKIRVGSHISHLERVPVPIATTEETPSTIQEEQCTAILEVPPTYLN